MPHQESSCTHFTNFSPIVGFKHFDTLPPQTTVPLIYVLQQRKPSVVVRWYPSFGCCPLWAERTNAHSGFFIGGQRLRTTVARSWWRRAKPLTCNADDADAMSGSTHAAALDCLARKATVRAIAYNVIAAQAC